MVCQTGGKSAEGALAGDVITEAADFPELAAPAETLQEVVVEAYLQEELGEEGPPHGFYWVSGPSGVAVALEDVDERLIIKVVESIGQLVNTAFGRLIRFGSLY